MTTTRMLVPLALTSAVLGGGVVAAAVALLDLGATSQTRTIVQQAALASGRVPAGDGGALTPSDSPTSRPSTPASWVVTPHPTSPS